jgi:hypothetical protein
MFKELEALLRPGTYKISKQSGVPVLKSVIFGLSTNTSAKLVELLYARLCVSSYAA